MRGEKFTLNGARAELQQFISESQGPGTVEYLASLTSRQRRWEGMGLGSHLHKQDPVSQANGLHL